MTEQYILYVIDTETTGTDYLNSEVIELSMSRFTFSDKIKPDQKTWYLQALKPETIQAEALKVNGHKLEDILCQTDFGKETYKHPEEVILDIEDWIAEDHMAANDRVFVAHNQAFDFNMMTNLWKSQNSIETFPFVLGVNAKVVDTKQLALIIDICMNKKRDKYNLGSLVKAYGVKKGHAHKASEDVRMALDLSEKMFRGIANDMTKELLKDVD